MTKSTATSPLFSQSTYTSCYTFGSWQDLNEDAVTLLHLLAEFQAIQVPTMYSILFQPCKRMPFLSGSALVGATVISPAKDLVCPVLTAKVMLTDQKISRLSYLCLCTL